MGFVRNLTLAEITGQLIGINDYLAKRGIDPVNQVVFMGMGEALSNFETFCHAVELFKTKRGYMQITGELVAVREIFCVYEFEE